MIIMDYGFWIVMVDIHVDHDCNEDIRPLNECSAVIMIRIAMIVLFNYEGHLQI